MKLIKIRDQEFYIPTEWMDTTIGQYIDICKLESVKDETMDIEYILRVYSILCNIDYEFLLKLYDTELTDVSECISNMVLNSLEPVENRKIIVGDKLYSFEPVGALTNAEKLSIQVLERSANTIFEQWLNVLSVMIRPATAKLDEFENVYYELDEFNGNIDLLNKRKEEFRKLPAPICMYVVNSFMKARD